MTDPVAATLLAGLRTTTLADSHVRLSALLHATREEGRQDD